MAARKTKGENGMSQGANEEQAKQTAATTSSPPTPNIASKPLTVPATVYSGSWEDIIKVAEQRRKAIIEEYNAVVQLLDHSGNALTLGAKIAATDIFVEKAISTLSQKAFWNGVLSAVSSIFFVILCMVYFDKSAGFPGDGLFMQVIRDIKSPEATLFALRKLAETTVFLAALYMAGSFAKAFAHEATVALNRRHALRFGRLYVWLNDGKVDAQMLADAFGGSFADASAFSNIDVGSSTKGIVSQVGDKITDGLNKVVDAVKGDK